MARADETFYIVERNGNMAKNTKFSIALRLGLVVFIAFVLYQQRAQAATFLTFVDDYPGFVAAVGTGAIATSEDFSTATDGAQVGPSGSPDTWHGFTASVYGTGTPSYGVSKYCSDLSASACINWNVSTPAVAGIYGSVGNYSATSSSLGISFRPTSTTIAGFSFDFVDWNDGGQRSKFIIVASDSSETVVTGPTNAYNAPPQNFSVTLSTGDIAAGTYITEIRLVGETGEAEVVGFYNFTFLTNPILASSTVAAPTSIPTLSEWGMIILSSLLVLGAVFTLRSRRL